MKEVLGELNRIKGVMGSLIAAPDGMIIASDLAVQTPDEVLGAMAASVGATVAKALDRMQQGLLIIFGSLPPAVLNFMVAEQFRQEPAKVASIVLIGNVMSAAFIPLGLAIALH